MRRLVRANRTRGSNRSSSFLKGLPPTSKAQPSQSGNHGRSGPLSGSKPQGRINLSELIKVARGEAQADLVIANARVVNTFTGEIEYADIAIHQGKIAGVGDYANGKRVRDIAGRYVVPGLIDGHFHLESSYLNVGEYARAVVPRGILAGVSDLHEIANVCGIPGLKQAMRVAKQMPMDLFMVAPSCVPATDMETSGRKLERRELLQLRRMKNVIGLGEFMDFPGVIRGDGTALDKLEAFSGMAKDGHAPGVTGRELNAYLAPLIGSDHETVGYAEGLEKLRRGMYLMIREGSTEKNLEALLPLVTDATWHRCMLVVDDRNASDIFHEGDLDAVVRKAVGLGLDPVRAIQMTTLVPANHFKLEGYGAVAPGYWANLLVVDDLNDFRAESVFYHGKLVGKRGRALFHAPPSATQPLGSKMNIKPFSVGDLAFHWDSAMVPVMEIVPGQITTKWVTEPNKSRDGVVRSDTSRDLVKAIVVERHKGTGNIGKGLVRGLGLKQGALATSVAHDCHNIVAVGVDDSEIFVAVNEVEANGGGLAVVSDGCVLASLPLPMAGLLSDMTLEEVVRVLEELDAAAEKLGCQVESPFSILSFLALPVVPELKLTDMGLVDVEMALLLEPEAF
ncbi:MAG: adenine deaminase [Dehalococcoidia bacterium]|nr:adenine deaminase [Dehalococcoidia bacterium]